jgi:hypothetical protein
MDNVMPATFSRVWQSNLASERRPVANIQINTFGISEIGQAARVPRVIMPDDFKLLGVFLR